MAARRAPRLSYPDARAGSRAVRTRSACNLNLLHPNDRWSTTLHHSRTDGRTPLGIPRRARRERACAHRRRRPPTRTTRRTGHEGEEGPDHRGSLEPAFAAVAPARTSRRSRPHARHAVGYPQRRVRLQAEPEIDSRQRDHQVNDAAGSYIQRHRRTRSIWCNSTSTRQRHCERSVDDACSCIGAQSASGKLAVVGVLIDTGRQPGLRDGLERTAREEGPARELGPDGRGRMLPCCARPSAYDGSLYDVLPAPRE